MQSRYLFIGAALLIAAAGPASTADSAGKQSMKGAVELNDGTKIPQNPSLPNLNLTNGQREQIRRAVLTKHNEVEFQLKSTKSAKNFTPAVGAKLPAGIKGQALPREVVSQIPQLRDYKYVKMKDQVLIVNGMTKQIIDMFPETQPLS
jgi:hypothetical protein